MIESDEEDPIDNDENTELEEEATQEPKNKK